MAMRTRRDAIIGLIHRVVYATLLSVFVWYLAVVPYAMTPIPHSIHHPLLVILDLPLALVSAHLPWQIKTVDALSSERQPEYANQWDYLYVHLRTAIPIYVGLFYLLNLLAWIVRRLSKRESRSADVESRVAGQT